MELKTQPSFTKFMFNDYDCETSRRLVTISIVNYLYPQWENNALKLTISIVNYLYLQWENNALKLKKNLF